MKCRHCGDTLYLDWDHTGIKKTWRSERTDDPNCIENTVEKLGPIRVQDYYVVAVSGLHEAVLG